MQTSWALVCGGVDYFFEPCRMTPAFERAASSCAAFEILVDSVGLGTDAHKHF